MSRGTLMERIRQVNARPPPEEDLWVRACVLVAVMAAALAVVAQGVGSPAFRVAVVGGLPAGYWYSWRTRYRDGFWLKVMVAVGAFLALAWFVGSIGPRAGGTFADAQIPLAELFLMIQVLHGLDVPARRDLLFSLLSGVVLMAVAGVLSVSMALVPYLLVWGVASVAALVLAHRSELCEVPALARRTGAAAGRHTLRPMAGVLAITLVSGLAIFFVIPPAGTSRALVFPTQLLKVLPLRLPGVLSNPSLGAGDPAANDHGFPGEAKAGTRSNRAPFGYFGFSTSLNLGARGRPNRTLVMRVRADRESLWRGQAFDVWDGRVWTISDQQPRALDGPNPIDVPPPAEEGPVLLRGPELVQTYYVAKPGPNLIFGAAPIAKLYFPDSRVYELTDGTVRAGLEVGGGSVYTVVSRPPLVTARDLRQADVNSGIPAGIVHRYAGAPVITPRVRDLAQQATVGAASTYDKVLALEGWLAINTRYTLDIPPLPSGADAVDQFLFVDRRGFCEQIATSLVVMLRSLGLPSRVVAGYAPGLRNPFTGLFEVRASDAHLWTEVWFPGVGWQSFDPTAVVPLAGDHGHSTAGTGLAAYLSGHLPRLPGWLEFVLMTAAGMALLGAVGAHLTAAWTRRRRRPQPSWADHCQARLEQSGAAEGRPRDQSQTVYEYAGVLRPLSPDGEQLDRVAALVSRAAFSGQALANEDRQWVEDVLDEIAPRRRGRRPRAR
jgi:transglutaminase-like putative cysteine protease